MTKLTVVSHRFTDLIPEPLEEGTLYVSIRYKTTAHLCCCGCGEKVVAPLSPTGWKLTFDGRSVSLSPSIGNWNLACQSHYFIEGNRVKWAARWTKEQIRGGFARDQAIKEEYYQAPEPKPMEPLAKAATEPTEPARSDARWIVWVRRLLGSR